MDAPAGAEQKNIERVWNAFRAKMCFHFCLTIEMSHRSGLIGQQAEIVLVILNLFLDVLELADDARAAIT